jgi:hypothetical protein
MGLLEREIYELRNLRRDYRHKLIDEKQVNTEIAIYSQTEKRAKLLLQAHVAGAKIKGGLLNEIFKTNLIGSGEAIDTGNNDPEADKILCPCHDKLITRGECLDYSGDHHDDCFKCEIGRATKDKLLPMNN